MKRKFFGLVLVLLLSMLALPHGSVGQDEFYLDFLVSRRLSLFAVNEEVLDEEVIGRRTWSILLRNYELSTVPLAQLEIKTARKPDAIRFSPNPDITVLDQGFFILRWRFEQILPKEDRGIWLSFDEDEMFRLGANITRIVDPEIFMNERGRLVCLAKIVSSSQLVALWVSMRVWETDEVSSRIERTEPTPSRERAGERGWAPTNIAKNSPYAFQVELDIVNKVFPSSLMYKPWVQVMQIHRHRTLSRAHSDLGASIPDDILGTVTWHVDGMHYWVRRYEEARDTIFEAVSTWPAGEYSVLNAIRGGQLRAEFLSEPFFRKRLMSCAQFARADSFQSTIRSQSRSSNDAGRFMILGESRVEKDCHL